MSSLRLVSEEMCLDSELNPGAGFVLLNQESHLHWMRLQLTYCGCIWDPRAAGVNFKIKVLLGQRLLKMSLLRIPNINLMKWDHKLCPWEVKTQELCCRKWDWQHLPCCQVINFLNYSPSWNERSLGIGLGSYKHLSGNRNTLFIHGAATSFLLQVLDGHLCCLNPLNSKLSFCARTRWRKLCNLI